MIIAIDGPAGSGKSTTAKLVAKGLGILHLDTGAMYRCVTLLALEAGIPHTNDEQLAELTRNMDIRFHVTPEKQVVTVGGRDVSLEIRSPEVTRHVSDYCAVPQVREILVDRQRAIGRAQDSVLEGRDIGTVVFPEAEFKFYLVADTRVRAERRQKEWAAKGITKSLQELEAELVERDRKDSGRSHSPLKKADDAREIDTSGMTIEEQVGAIVAVVRGAVRGSNSASLFVMP